MKSTWTLVLGMQLVQLIEKHMSASNQFKYHAALAGSVLHKGISTKDVDIILYPHRTDEKLSNKDLFDRLEKIGVKMFKRIDFHEYDDKIVFWCSFENKRVDIFLME